jgi:hypothetical protein
LRPVLTIILVILALVAVVVFLLLENTPMATNDFVNNNLDTNNNLNIQDPIIPFDNNLNVIPPVVEDLSIDCASDFSCFLNNILTCTPDVTYTQEDSFSYVESGTKYSFLLGYTSLGFNEFNECEVSLDLVNHDYTFTDSEKQKYLNDNYTEAGVLEIEASLNMYNRHLISKTGVCKLDASAYTVSTSSTQFLDSIMQNIQNCSGDLFSVTENISDASFYIYVNK